MTARVQNIDLRKIPSLNKRKMLQVLSQTMSKELESDFEQFFRDRFYAVYLKYYEKDTQDKELAYKEFIESETTDIQDFVTKRWFVFYKKEQSAKMSKEEKVESLREAVEQYKRGNVISHEDLIKQFEEEEGRGVFDLD